jgi:hypothetical protein
MAAPISLRSRWGPSNLTPKSINWTSFSSAPCGPHAGSGAISATTTSVVGAGGGRRAGRQRGERHEDRSGFPLSPEREPQSSEHRDASPSKALGRPSILGTHQEPDTPKGYSVLFAAHTTAVG